MPTVKIEVIVNSRSGAGHGDGIQMQLEQAFSSAELPVRISVANSGSDIFDLAKQAVESEADIIVAAGGDGTVSSVAKVLLDRNKVLGVLPLGTLNHFAKDLGIPLELEGAIATIKAGHETRVDIGTVNDHTFINNSSLGLYPSIVREREKQQKLGWGKWPAYIWAAVAVLRRYPFLDVRLDVDDRQMQSHTPFVFIGNNEYQMETLNVGTRACIDKGQLSLYMTNRTGRLGLLRLAFRALFGGLRQEKDFVAMCTKEIWIGTKHRRLRVALDGEVTVLEPPLHYHVLPGALRVLTPAEPPELRT